MGSLNTNYFPERSELSNYGRTSSLSLILKPQNLNQIFFQSVSSAISILNDIYEQSHAQRPLAFLIGNLHLWERE